MSDASYFGDIIIIGAIAAFILLRYRSMLGDKSGRDPSDIARRDTTKAEDMETIIQLPQQNQAAVTAPVPTVTFDDYNGETREHLRAMHKIDPDFTAEGFLEGAKSAYEMVVEAYRETDRDTLKMLLSKPLFTQFDDALKEEEKTGRKTENTLVAINKAIITEAELSGNKATLTVEFDSEQIHLIRGKEGEIVEGSASEEVTVEDTWRFSRDLKSADPNWTIIDT